jgi:hypothetical protein
MRQARITVRAFLIPSVCACGRLAQTVSALRCWCGAIRRAELKLCASPPPGPLTADSDLGSLWERWQASQRDLATVRSGPRFRRKLSQIAPPSRNYAGTKSLCSGAPSPELVMMGKKTDTRNWKLETGNLKVPQPFALGGQRSASRQSAIQNHKSKIAGSQHPVPIDSRTMLSRVSASGHDFSRAGTRVPKLPYNGLLAAAPAAAKRPRGGSSIREVGTAEAVP